MWGSKYFTIAMVQQNKIMNEIRNEQDSFTLHSLYREYQNSVQDYM